MTTATLPSDKFDLGDKTFVWADNAPSRAPLDKLAVLPGFNTRVKDEEYEARVNATQDSITQHGYYENKPLAVVQLAGDPMFYVYDGEHRLEAAKRASLDGVAFPDGLPIAFAKEGATIRDLTISLVRNNDGANLNQVELAATVKRLADDGMNGDEIAAVIGRSARQVNNLLALNGANATTKRAVASGEIAAINVVKLLRKKTPAQVDQEVKNLVAIAKARGAKKATARTTGDSAPARPTGPKMKRVEAEISLATGTALGDVMKAVVAKVRETIKLDDDENLVEDGRIVVVMHVIDHEAEAARAAAEKAKAEAAQKREAEKAQREKDKAEAAKAKEAEAKKKAAEKAKADKAKAAEKAKADAAKAKAATAAKPKTTASKPKAAGSTAKGKAADGGKTSESAESAAQAALAEVATPAAGEAGSTPQGASSGESDGNNGL